VSNSQDDDIGVEEKVGDFAAAEYHIDSSCPEGRFADSHSEGLESVAESQIGRDSIESIIPRIWTHV